MLDELKHMCEILEEELSNVNKKVDKSGGKLSGDDISYIDKLTHSIKSIKTTMAMMDAEDDGYSRDDGMDMSDYSGRYPGRYYSGNGYSMAGRGSYARRDSMGRYKSRGYSRNAETDDIIDQLKDIMHNAKDDRTRQEFQKFINKVETM